MGGSLLGGIFTIVMLAFGIFTIMYVTFTGMSVTSTKKATRVCAYLGVTVTAILLLFLGNAINHLSSFVPHGKAISEHYDVSLANYYQTGLFELKEGSKMPIDFLDGAGQKLDSSTPTEDIRFGTIEVNDGRATLNIIVGEDDSGNPEWAEYNEQTAKQDVFFNLLQETKNK